MSDLKSRILALAALQPLILFIILSSWSDRTVAEMIYSHVLPAYVLVQLYLHWGLWEEKTYVVVKKDETKEIK